MTTFNPTRKTVLTPAELQSKATQTVLALKTECLKKGKGPGTPEMAVVERLLKAIKSLPAYEAAELAVIEAGLTGVLPAAAIRKLRGE